MTVVSNTSPLRYLSAIGRTDLVQDIFGRVLIPRAVESELLHPAAPQRTREWLAGKPQWIEVRDLAAPPHTSLLQKLDSGEAEAIQLALDTKADFLIIDERVGRQTATAHSLTVVGILGILLESYRRGKIAQPTELLLDLQRAGFRVSRRLVTEFQKQLAIDG